MPYKDPEKQKAAVRKAVQKHAVRERRRVTLDRLGTFLGLQYLRKLVKFKDDKLVDGTSRIESEIVAMSYGISEFAKKHSPAYHFAWGIWRLSRPTWPKENYNPRLESMLNWIRAFDDLVRKPTKANEKREQEKWDALDPVWKNYLDSQIGGIKRK